MLSDIHFSYIHYVRIVTSDVQVCCDLNQIALLKEHSCWYRGLGLL